MTDNISAQELFLRVKDMLTLTVLHPEVRNKMMHDTLILCCHEGVSTSGQAFGNLFSQTDYLCKKHRLSLADKIDVQTMRRHSNSAEKLSREDLQYDARALSLLIAAVFDVAIPTDLLPLIAHTNRPAPKRLKINYSRLRVIVQEWDEEFMHVSVDQETELAEYLVRVKDADNHIDHSSLLPLLSEGTQLNLIDCQVGSSVILARLIVYEPDFLLDISGIAACFAEYGHHPLLHLVNQMKPRPNTQATLLGNFAGSALDDIINSQGTYRMIDTVKGNFREKALEFSTCKDFDAAKFYQDAQLQASNLEQVVKVLFQTYDREKAILEPSFVCEALGIQGRVDLMTTDCRLLVEQKSGRNLNIERHQTDALYHCYQLQPHYVQLLLYYGVLQQNFRLPGEGVNIHLLYSKYSPKEGLMSVAYYQALFREAIQYRNEVVATSFGIARRGFAEFIGLLTPETLNVARLDNYFYQRYLQPQLAAITGPLHSLTPLEKAYYCQMMTFVAREQLISKVGAQEGTNTSASDLWAMPLAEKRDAGNIYTDLRIVKKEQSSAYNGYDTITLSVPQQGEDFLPNFRVGDMVYLYACQAGSEPDVRRAILYKGVLQEIHTDSLVVHLNDGQQNPRLFDDSAIYAIEHGASDVGTGSNCRSLHQFISASKERRDLLLGQCAPRADKTLALSKHYDDILDDIILRAKQAQDYFLLVGPPGTGKTSRALRFLVQEALTVDGNILLMSYTNRAVDEICEMLLDANISFLRLGSEFSCDARFRPYLLEKAIADCPKLDAIKRRLLDTRIVVGTTSMLQSKSFIFDLKHFRLAIVDESSQILEPGLVGLLTQVDKFILIGDHKQLPAVVQQSEQESAVNDEGLRSIGLSNCRNALFERLIHWERHEKRDDFIGILRRQGRMHPDIAAFPNKMFYSREQLEPVPCPHQLDTSLHYDLPSLDALDDRLKQQRMIFIPSQYCKAPNVSDKVNSHEATIVARLLSRIHRFYGKGFDAQKTVGVIVPYRNQIAMIRKEIEKLGIGELDHISIDTVERYQGSQRDVIIYSFTIQNRWQLEFLTANSLVEDGHVIDRKLNVAITRARKQMIMTGNVDVLSQNEIFRQLIAHVSEQGGLL